MTSTRVHFFFKNSGSNEFSTYAHETIIEVAGFTLHYHKSSELCKSCPFHKFQQWKKSSYAFHQSSAFSNWQRCNFCSCGLLTYKSKIWTKISVWIALFSHTSWSTISYGIEDFPCLYILLHPTPTYTYSILLTYSFWQIFHPACSLHPASPSLHFFQGLS